jgi:hypothetical protein
MSTTIAMGFDWSLFLLMRYRECVLRGDDNWVRAAGRAGAAVRAGP